jgi:hypothetical protein
MASALLKASYLTRMAKKPRKKKSQNSHKKSRLLLKRKKKCLGPKKWWTILSRLLWEMKGSLRRWRLNKVMSKSSKKPIILSRFSISSLRNASDMPNNSLISQKKSFWTIASHVLSFLTKEIDCLKSNF